MSEQKAAEARVATIPAKRFGMPDGVRAGLRLPVLGACRLHHRAEPADRRRRLRRRVLIACAEFDAQPRRRAPDHVALLVQAIAVDHQREIVGDAELARDFQTGAGGGQIAHAAVDAGGAVEADGAAL